MPRQFDGIALGSIAAGTLLAYAGIRNVSIPAAVQGIIQGKSPQRLAGKGPNAIQQVTQTETPAGTTAIPPSPELPGGTVGGTFTAAQIASLWTDKGGDPATAGFAAQVAMSESGGRAAVTSSNPDGGTNVGLYQLDTPGGVGGGHSIQELQDPGLNTQITILATKNGRDWSSWSDPVVNALPGRQYTPGGQ